MLNLKINTIVVEKDLSELNIVYSELKKINELSIVGKTTSAKQGISLITNFVPTLVLINIELKDMDGIEFARILHNRNIQPEIVFMAKNNHLAFKCLEVEPFDFLIKPIKKEDFEQMLIRLKEKLRKKELMRKMNIFAQTSSMVIKRIFKQKGGIVVVALEEIVYCNAELTSTVLVLRCGEKFKLKSGIKETLETINSEDFIRVGRSYFINRSYIRKIDKRKHRCHLYYEGNNWDIPISRNTIGALEKLNVSPMN